MFVSTIAHYEERSNVFNADKMSQIHDIMFVCICFGRTFNRADSKNSVMKDTKEF
jgi:hypothetical protein